MPKEIWNEGRVTGLSAYEIYVKQHLVEDPTNPPATEREWLSASIAMGSSMLLKVPAVDQGTKSHTYVDIPLPTNTKLAAANTIIAQFFDGDAIFEDSGNWGFRITDYGQLISNTASLSPEGEVDSADIPADPSAIPLQPLADWGQDKKEQLKNYLKIIDGLVLQPGTWVRSVLAQDGPEKDFQANLGSVYPTVRLHVRGMIDADHRPLVLLTGFTIRSVLAGVVGQDTVTESASPQDGDFLGPAVFPWAAKIMFSVPNSYISYFDSGAYERRLNSPTSLGNLQRKTIQDTPVIDMQASKLEDYYSEYPRDYYPYYVPTYSADTDDPRYPYHVDDFVTLGNVDGGDGAAVLTIYRKRGKYPPALYGTFVNSVDGSDASTKGHSLNPIDVVAPGTIKMFYQRNATLLKEYQDTFPGTTGMNKKSDGTIQILNDGGDLVDVANISRSYLYNEISDNIKYFTSPYGKLSGDTRPKIVNIQTGDKSAWALMMSRRSTGTTEDDSDVSIDGDTPIPIEISPTPSSTISLTHNNSSDNISWSALLAALSRDKSIDLLGSRLKDLKYTLVKPANSSQAQTSVYNTSGSAYIEYGTGSSDTLRLYISSTAPNTAGVPEGSIGIGWGFAPSNNS